MAHRFVVHCCPSEPASFDYRWIDQILGSDLADFQPRLLEPGVWLLEGDGARWARHILQTLTMRIQENDSDGRLSMRVRSLADPLDRASWPAGTMDEGDLDELLLRHQV
ncbi:MAG: hypothetical protein ABR524_11730 [Thermoanaerobaculia bacterium]